VRAAAADALVRMQGWLKTVDLGTPLRDAMADRDRKVRGCAADALLDISPDAMVALLEARDQDWRVRFAAVQCCRRAGGGSEARFERGLCTALSDTNAYVRHEALKTIERPSKQYSHNTWKVDDAFSPYIRRLLADPNSFVRVAAVQAARRCGVQLSVAAYDRVVADSNRAVSHAAAGLSVPERPPVEVQKPRPAPVIPAPPKLPETLPDAFAPLISSRLRGPQQPRLRRSFLVSSVALMQKMQLQRNVKQKFQNMNPTVAT
jgi:HEAT repeat protein